MLTLSTITTWENFGIVFRIIIRGSKSNATVINRPYNHDKQDFNYPDKISFFHAIPLFHKVLLQSARIVASNFYRVNRFRGLCPMSRKVTSII